MKFRIWRCEGFYAVQRKRWWGWEYLDACNAWCQWYGKNHPKKFSTEKEVYQFLESGSWITKEVPIVVRREYQEIEK